MNKTFVTLVIALAVIGMVGFGVWAAGGHCKTGAGACATSGPAACCDMSQNMTTLKKSVDEAIAAVKKDDKEAALKALTTAKGVITRCEEQCAKMAGAAATTGFANDRCPIMGSPIDPKNVKASLVREFNGQKVAFCCGGCPEKWDKLSDKEKQAKLDAVKAKPAKEAADPKAGAGTPTCPMGGGC